MTMCLVRFNYVSLCIYVIILVPCIPNGNRTDKLRYEYTRGRVVSINVTEQTLMPAAIGVARIVSGVHFSYQKSCRLFSRRPQNAL